MSASPLFPDVTFHEQFETASPDEKMNLFKAVLPKAKILAAAAPNAACSLVDVALSETRDNPALSDLRNDLLCAVPRLAMRLIKRKYLPETATLLTASIKHCGMNGLFKDARARILGSFCSLLAKSVMNNNEVFASHMMKQLSDAVGVSAKDLCTLGGKTGNNEIIVIKSYDPKSEAFTFGYAPKPDQKNYLLNKTLILPRALERRLQKLLKPAGPATSEARVCTHN